LYDFVLQLLLDFDCLVVVDLVLMNRAII